MVKKWDQKWLPWATLLNIVQNLNILFVFRFASCPNLKVQVQVQAHDPQTWTKPNQTPASLACSLHYFKLNENSKIMFKAC